MSVHREMTEAEKSCEPVFIKNHIKNLQWGNNTITNLYMYWYDSCGNLSDGVILDIDEPDDKAVIKILFDSSTWDSESIYRNDGMGYYYMRDSKKVYVIGIWKHSIGDTI